jgi:hypothetical protein
MHAAYIKMHFLKAFSVKAAISCICMHLHRYITCKLKQKVNNLRFCAMQVHW